MIMDSLLTFSLGQTVAVGNSTKVVDFGQAKPRMGLLDRDFFIVVRAGEGFEAGTLQVEVQESDDGETFATTYTTAAMADFEQVAIPVPREHKRYMRLKYTPVAASGGSLAGKLHAFIVDNLSEVESFTREVE